MIRRLGNFALAIPQAVHGNDDFDVSFSGYGVKLQLFPFTEQRGLFVGVETSLSRLQIERRGSDLAANQTQLGAGVQAGYRLALPAGFYATAWIGVGYAFGADAVTLDGATFQPSALLVFPAVHLGYRFL